MGRAMTSAMRKAVLLATGVALLAAVTAWLVIRHNVTRASLSHSVATGFGGIASCARQRTAAGAAMSYLKRRATAGAHTASSPTVTAGMAT